MRKHIYLLIFAVLGLMTSCGSDDITDRNAELEGQVFTAETEMPGDTRTSLSPDRYIYWTEGDQISIFNKFTAADQFELSTGAGTPNANFKQISSAGFGSGSDIPHVVAVYPYKENYIISNMSSTGYTIDNVVIPSEQTYVENSFSQGAMPMIAVTSSHNLKFKNAGALIKLNIKASAPGVGINKITFESRSAISEVIAGKSVITVGSDGKNPFIKMKDGGSTMITLNCNNVKLSDATATSFYIALPAINFVNGFTITLYDDASHSMTLNSKASDLKRNQIMVMPTIVFKSSEIPSYVKWIDLDLPSGVKWASCNVGATCPEEYGNYYAWGETAAKSDYSWETYLYRHWDAKGFWSCDDLGDISGNAKYDVARASWGGAARMPTDMELVELRNGKNCTWTWTQQNGVNGQLVKSVRNGNSIFLPAAGWRKNSLINEAGDVGLLWSSTQWETDQNSYFLLFDHFGSYEVGPNNRYFGYSVRPVQD